MGQGDEYSRDAYTGEQYAYDSDSDSDDFDSQLDPEDWQANYHEEIWDAWVTLEEFMYDMQLTMHCGYTDFANFLTFPQVHGTAFGSSLAHAAWNRLTNVPIVRERVRHPEHFHAWFDSFVF